MSYNGNTMIKRRKGIGTALLREATGRNKNTAIKVINTDVVCFW